MRTLIIVLCLAFMGMNISYAQDHIDCSQINFDELERISNKIKANKIAKKKDETSFTKRFNENLLEKKLKYIGEITRSSDVLDVDDKKDDSGDIKDQKSTQTLFSIGYNYEINPVDILKAFDSEDKMTKEQKTNFYLLKSIRLQDLKLIATGAYSNTLLNELGEGVGESVKTEEKFTYAFGMRYTGCFSSLLKGKIGCVEKVDYSNTPEQVTMNMDDITVNKLELLRLFCMLKKLEERVKSSGH